MYQFTSNIYTNKIFTYLKKKTTEKFRGLIHKQKTPSLVSNSKKNPKQLHYQSWRWHCTELRNQNWNWNKNRSEKQNFFLISHDVGHLTRNVQMTSLFRKLPIYIPIQRGNRPPPHGPHSPSRSCIMNLCLFGCAIPGALVKYLFVVLLYLDFFEDTLLEFYSNILQVPIFYYMAAF